MSNMERRFTELRVECRLRSEANESRTIGGYASVFNKRSDDLGGFYEVVGESAFNQSRGRGFPGVVALYNHDQNMLLGTTAARTLRIDTDEHGLIYEVDLPSARADLHELVQRGDVSKSSFAFRVVGDDGDEWEMDDKGQVRRTLHNVQLFDVSAVNTPAYPDATVGARSQETAFRSLAAHISADPADVLAAASEHTLHKFFRRTDGGSAPKTTTLSGPELLALVANKRRSA